MAEIRMQAKYWRRPGRLVFAVEVFNPAGILHGMIINRLVGRMIFFTALAALSIPQAAMAQIALPDLTIDAARLQSSIEIKTSPFRTNDCAVVEGCVDGKGKRTLLRFDVATPNIGTGDLVLGDPRSNTNLFEFSPCHGHYHFTGYASYELLTTSDTTVITGRKQAFCLLDFARYSSTAGPGKFTCDYQGISAGWQDIYGSYLDCQWLDITGVLPGDYLLRITINPEQRLIESNYSNNTATATVRIAPKGRK